MRKRRVDRIGNLSALLTPLSEMVFGVQVPHLAALKETRSSQTRTRNTQERRVPVQTRCPEVKANYDK